MTTIGVINVTAPHRYDRSGYIVSFDALLTQTEFEQMRELFAKAEYGTAVHQITGERPYGEDLTADAVNTVYCTFTHGTSGKVQDGWYLLRPSFTYVEGESAEGHAYVCAFQLFFLGTDAYYQSCYNIIELESEENDWEI